MATSHEIPTFQPRPVIDAILLAAHKLGRRIGIDNSTTFLSVLAPAILALILFWYYQRPGNLKNAQISQTHDSTSPAKMTAKPEDGSVRVSNIYVHPIKSCRGTSVQTANYHPEGLENDRKWAIMDATTNVVITARESPKMVLITPRIVPDPASPHGGVLVVAFPEESGCASFNVPLQPTAEILSSWEIIHKIGFLDYSDSVDGYVGQALPSATPAPSASEILSVYFGKPVHLIYKGPRVRPLEGTAAFPELEGTAVYQDGYPLLVLSAESMGAVESEVRSRVGTQGIAEAWREDRIVLRRFRPNIVVNGGGPFAEDAWEEVTLGSRDAPPITLVSKCTRCLLPNVSPDTGERDKAVPYKVIMKFRTGLDPVEKMKPCVGCNGVPSASGVVSVGDVVYVKKMA